MYNIQQGGQAFSLAGYIIVKDKNGNTFAVTKDDPKYLSGELKFVWKDKNIRLNLVIKQEKQ